MKHQGNLKVCKFRHCKFAPLLTKNQELALKRNSGYSGYISGNSFFEGLIYVVTYGKNGQLL